MKENRYIGAIQDTSADRDSSGYMAFYPCYTCKDTYEIIFAYKGGKQARKDQGYDGIRKDFDGGCADDFAKLECFAFVVPMKDPEKQSDMHTLNMDFPAAVKIYKRISGNKWRFLTSRQIKTFNDYAAMQLAYVYHKWD